MLHLLADVLMVATRMEPPRRPHEHPCEGPRRPHPLQEENRRRVWSLIGGIRI